METTEMYRKRAVAPKERVVFDPSNKQHMLDYAQFIQYNNWKNGCNYLLEYPYQDIPTMINEKIVQYVLYRKII